MKVYPIGSDSYKAVERIDELMQEPSMLLIDVRLNAYSWRVDFREQELRTRYRQKYHTEGKRLGNVARRGTNLIIIASPVAGMQGLVRYLSGGHDLVLLYQDEQQVKEICRLLVGVRANVEVIKFASVITNGPA